MSLLTPLPRRLFRKSLDARAVRRLTFMLVLRAYLYLLVFDLLLSRGNFAMLCEKVRRVHKEKREVRPGDIERICEAFDLASVWYWKQVLCLQRSAATVCFLKRHGIAAEMVIGAQLLPFKAHAWVEVAGVVVNDKSYVREDYQVIDRC